MSWWRACEACDKPHFAEARTPAALAHLDLRSKLQRARHVNVVARQVC